MRLDVNIFGRCRHSIMSSMLVLASVVAGGVAALVAVLLLSRSEDFNQS